MAGLGGVDWDEPIRELEEVSMAIGSWVMDEG